MVRGIATNDKTEGVASKYIISGMKITKEKGEKAEEAEKKVLIIGDSSQIK